MVILFTVTTVTSPTVSTAGLKFGIISVVKDKIEELKEKKKEKIAKEMTRIRHFEGETNAQGTASFTLPDGKNISCYVYDEEIENLPISGIKVYLITDGEGNKGAYFIVDPEGEYCPQIVNAFEYGESQSISGSEAEYQAQFIGLGKKIWLTFKKGWLGGNAPDPLHADIIDQDLLDYILGNLLVYMYSCTLYDLMPYSSYWDFLKSQLKEHGAEFVVTTLILGLGLPVAIASAVVDLAIFGQDAYWYKYYRDRGYTDQDWFDIYQKINIGNIGMYVVYPRKSIPPSESKGAIGGKIIDSSGDPISGVFVQHLPPSGTPKELFTGLTGLFYFEDISAGTYEVKASLEGYDANWLEDISPGDTDLVITLSPANQIPVISSLSAPSSVFANSSSLVTCNASDPDGDPLTYTWSCNGGSISGSGYQVTWNAPSSEGTYQVKVVASDPDGRKAIKTRDIYVSRGARDEGTKKWEFKTGGHVESSPAIGSDGTIYVGCNDNKLYAINSDGTKKWEFKTGGHVESSPAIGSDGTIYVGCNDNKLYAINPDGTKKWGRFLTGGGRIESSPAIGSDGTIYVGSDDRRLHARNPDGTKKWEFLTGFRVYSSPAIGSDGTIYVGSWDKRLYAINPDGTKKWEFLTVGLVDSSPAIGSDGTIYVGSYDYKLYAINPDGTKKWEFLTGDGIYSSPAIGSDGTIYVGSYDDKLHAINPDGTKKWEFLISGVWSSPAISSDGTIYVGSYYKLYAINSDGTKKWEFETGDVRSSPAIGSDGTIYVGSWDNKLYAVYGSGSLANTPWPMFHHDLKHTGRQ